MFVLVGGYDEAFESGGESAAASNGEVIVFKTREEAEEVAERMNDMCWEIFRGSWDPSLYDHMLSPMAWGVLELPNKTTPATSESVSHIFERYKEIVQQRPSSMD